MARYTFMRKTLTTLQPELELLPGLLFTYFSTENLGIFSRSCGSALCVLLLHLQFALHVLLLYLKLASFQPELRECASHNTLCLQFAISQPRLWKCSSRTTFLYLKLAICQPELRARFAHYFLQISVPELRKRTARATFALRSCNVAAGALGLLFAGYFVIESCDFQAGAAADQAGGTRDKVRS